jgi:hypothetical protein
MALNWAAILQAFPPVAATQPAGLNNAGISAPNYFSPINPSQASISTLFHEYPLIDPTYQNSFFSVIFSTSFGQYSFSQTQPWMSFIYRDGTPLVLHSIFYVNSTFPTPITFSGYRGDNSYLDNNHFRYTVNVQTGRQLPLSGV